MGHRRRRAAARGHPRGGPAHRRPRRRRGSADLPLRDAPSAALGDDVASVTGVRFVPGGRITWFDAGETDYAIGEPVIVDGEREQRLGWIAVPPARRTGRPTGGDDRRARRVIRRANERDLRAEHEGETDRARALRLAMDRAAALRLPLKVFRVEVMGQLSRGARLNVYYTSDERLDLRELIRRPRQPARRPDRAAPARRPRRGQGRRRHRLVRAHALLHDVAPRLRAGLDQDGQGPGARAVADQGLRPVRAAQVLPGLRAGRLRRAPQGAAQARQARDRRARRGPRRRGRRAPPARPRLVRPRRHRGRPRRRGAALVPVGQPAGGGRRAPSASRPARLARPREAPRHERPPGAPAPDARGPDDDRDDHDEPDASEDRNDPAPDELAAGLAAAANERDETEDPDDLDAPDELGPGAGALAAATDDDERAAAYTVDDEDEVSFTDPRTLTDEVVDRADDDLDADAAPGAPAAARRRPDDPTSES